jgi:hypothetical protein
VDSGSVAATPGDGIPALLLLAQGGEGGEGGESAKKGQGGEGGEGGEGGQGGETGFDGSKATSDPVIYLSGLDVIRAHYIAGVAAYNAGEQLPGAEMFAHGRSEIYVELEPALTKLGVPEFDDLMQKTGDLAQSGAPATEVEAAAKVVYAALDGAEKKTPGGVSDAVETKVLADLLDRAALQYAKALRETAGDAYLDGYGFTEAAKLRSAKVLAYLDKTNSEAAAAAREALAALAAAYPSIKKPGPDAVKPGPALVATSKFRLALSSG